MAVAWAGWWYRNSITHEEQWCNRDVGVVGFLVLVEDYEGYAAAVHQPHPMAPNVVSQSRWIHPSEDDFRVNSDGVVMGVEGSGLGVVVRDGSRKICSLGVRRVRARWTTPMAEAAAALWGIQLAKRYGFTSVELEKDALTLSQAISLRKMDCSPLDLLIKDICALGESFISFHAFYVNVVGILLPTW